jgi:cysteine-rich repeat protein
VTRTRSCGRRQRGLGVLALMACLGLLAAAAGCGDDAEDATLTDDAGAVEAGAVDECRHKDDGLPCGSGKHCFGQRCVDDECGDGVLSGDERCDDGNQDWGDGCDRQCQPERPGCPDGELAGDEECDDGNWIDDDECSNRCMSANQCGNARVDPGEDCDDGNVVDDDACTNECMHYECGNGRLDPGEECDDGNIADRGDGCTNACKITVCGNGKIEKYETCDDGNLVDGDGCARDCVNAICGNGIVEPAGGEVCEGPRVLPAAGGRPAGPRTCTGDCRNWVTEDRCAACLNQKCTEFAAGVDVVKGCFVAVDPDPVFGIDPNDPTFIQRCIDLVDCAVVHRCGFTAFQAPECYCGSASPDVCLASGPADDAPCPQAWLAAARAETNVEMWERFSDTIYPTGWAYYVLDCYRTQCPDECVPPPMSSAP